VPRPIARATSALLIASLLFACSLFRSRQPPPPPPAPSPSATPTPQPTPTPVPHHHRRRRHRNHEAASASEMTPTPTPTTEGSPSVTPTRTPALGTATPTASPTPSHPARVSIGDESADKSAVQHQLDRTQINLNKANASFGSLTSDDKAAYYQAWSLLSAAQQAQKQGDYLAASSLAQKAAVLSDRFKEAATP
jgi:hypothetical protein